MDKSLLPFVVYPILIVIVLAAGYLNILPSATVLYTFSLLIGGLLLPSPFQQQQQKSTTNEGGTKSNV